MPFAMRKVAVSFMRDTRGRSMIMTEASNASVIAKAVAH